MSMPSSPGKMDLSALGGLKRRTLQPVPDAVEPSPAPAEAEVPAEPVEASVAAVEPDTADPVEQPAPAEAPTPAAEPVVIEPAEEEHSGHVTLYLPRDLNQWLAQHHDQTDVSYPGIVLNAISWAAGEGKLAEIFAPVDSPIPANDIFGRAPAISKPVRSSAEPETRPVRFRRDHMKVIISLARTWTADNRNAFFTGVLSAYRDHLDNQGS